MNDEEREVLTPAGVAALYGCNPKTVSRWCDQGRLPYFLTPAGSRRFYADEVKALIGATRKERRA